MYLEIIFSLTLILCCEFFELVCNFSKLNFIVVKFIDPENYSFLIEIESIVMELNNRPTQSRRKLTG